MYICQLSLQFKLPVSGALSVASHKTVTAQEKPLIIDQLIHVPDADLQIAVGDQTFYCQS